MSGRTLLPQPQRSDREPSIDHHRTPELIAALPTRTVSKLVSAMVDSITVSLIIDHFSIMAAISAG